MHSFKRWSKLQSRLGRIRVLTLRNHRVEFLLSKALLRYSKLTQRLRAVFAAAQARG